jgi:hypothetical protein
MIWAVWFYARPAKASAELGVSPPPGNIAAIPPQPKSAPTGVAASHLQTTGSSLATTAKGKEQEMVEGLSTKNDIPIDFYGKLEDQFGKPVVGAEITGSTIIYNGTKTGSTRVTATSDASGLFEIHAGKGESLGVIPKKEGYALATTAVGFRYSHLDQNYFVPDPNSPVVMKMWKLQGSEPLLSIGQTFKFRYTDNSVNFDLLTGKIVPSGGDITMILNRSPGVISGRTRQDWGVEIQAVQGGLIESSGDERVTYWAPESGYQPSYSFTMSTNPPNKWHGGWGATFYIKSRNQNPDDYVWVEFRGVANTNGSRNWEATAGQ